MVESVSYPVDEGSSVTTVAVWPSVEAEIVIADATVPLIYDVIVE
jgi:hypothetical protein